MIPRLAVFYGPDSFSSKTRLLINQSEQVIPSIFLNNENSMIKRMLSSSAFILLFYWVLPIHCWNTVWNRAGVVKEISSGRRISRDVPVLHMAVDVKEKEATVSKKTEEDLSSAERVTEKYGLEVGLFQSLQKSGSDGGLTATSLLKKYGIAYLATSIPLAIVSFAVCYVLVDIGIDVESLLHQVPGLQNVDLGNAGTQAGTVAIAYAAHKAASPLRFPPTVILTPIVAKFLGKEPSAEGEGK